MYSHLHQFNTESQHFTAVVSCLKKSGINNVLILLSILSDSLPALLPGDLSQPQTYFSSSSKMVSVGLIKINDSVCIHCNVAWTCCTVQLGVCGGGYVRFLAKQTILFNKLNFRMVLVFGLFWDSHQVVSDWIIWSCSQPPSRLLHVPPQLFLKL